MSTPSIVLLKSTLEKNGGLEKYAIEIAKGFTERGYRLTLLTTGAENTSFPFPVISYHFRSKMSFRKVAEFDLFCRSYVERENPSLIFGLDRNSLQTHIRAGNGVHAAYLNERKKREGFWKGLSFSANPLHRRLLELEKTAFEHPKLQKLFTNSDMVRRQVLHYYNTDPNKICVIHNGVEWTRMQVPFDAWPEKKRLQTDRLQLLFLGHNFRRKGLDYLLDALTQLPKGDFHLNVVGKDKNEARYKKRVQALHLEKNVTFFGPVPSAIPFYQLSDVLIIPSLYDPFANVTVEALAMGLFVLSSSNNGASEILTKDNGMILSSLTDKDCFVEALITLMDKKKTLSSSLQIRNSIQYLDFPNQLNKMIDLC